MLWKHLKKYANRHWCAFIMLVFSYVNNCDGLLRSSATAGFGDDVTRKNENAISVWKSYREFLSHWINSVKISWEFQFFEQNSKKYKILWVILKNNNEFWKKNDKKLRHYLQIKFKNIENMKIQNNF